MSADRKEELSLYYTGLFSDASFSLSVAIRLPNLIFLHLAHLPSLAGLYMHRYPRIASVNVPAIGFTRIHHFTRGW